MQDLWALPALVGSRALMGPAGGMPAWMRPCAAATCQADTAGTGRPLLVSTALEGE